MLKAAYSDGRSSQLHPVELWLDGQTLHVAGAGIERSMPFAEVSVSERLGSAPRLIRFGDGSFCEIRDHIGLAALLQQVRYREGRVDRLQRHKPAIFTAVVATIALLFSGYRWGLPFAADQAAQRLPPIVGRTLGEQSLQVLDRGLFHVSKLDPRRRQRLLDRFSALHLAQAPPQLPKLEFRFAPGIGANAFTLPDGSIVLLDQLVSLLDDDQVIAVLAHEMGHVQERHPLRNLIQGSALAAFWAVYAGDVSSLLAAAPAAVLQARYSRAFEQAADDDAVNLLRANQLSPDLLAQALEKIQATRHEAPDVVDGFLSSHPATDARIARLRRAARQIDL